MSELETDRLRLRRAKRDDVAAFHAILSDPVAMAFWSTPPHSSLEETDEWISAMIKLEPHQGDDFVVEHDGQVIGKAGLYRFPEIGFIFRRESWGFGFAAEALRPIIARGLELHQLGLIKADVDPRNIASLRLLDHLGFLEVRRARRTWLVGDQWCDSVYLQLSAERWNGG